MAQLMVVLCLEVKCFWLLQNIFLRQMCIFINHRNASFLRKCCLAAVLNIFIRGKKKGDFDHHFYDNSVSKRNLIGWWGERVLLLVVADVIFLGQVAPWIDLSDVWNICHTESLWGDFFREEPLVFCDKQVLPLVIYYIFNYQAYLFLSSLLETKPKLDAAGLLCEAERLELCLQWHSLC